MWRPQETYAVIVGLLVALVIMAACCIGLAVIGRFDPAPVPLPAPAPTFAIDR